MDNKTARTQIIAHIESLSHHNLHNEALIATAAHFDQDDLVDAFEGYQSEQASLGYMPEAAIARRNVDKRRLMDSIELMEGEQERKLFASLL